jgi:glutamate-1-semialdehyde 2,1-aminomutase
MFRNFFHRLLEESIYWPPSQFEAAFVSLAHSYQDIQLTINQIGKAICSLGI